MLARVHVGKVTRGHALSARGHVGTVTRGQGANDERLSGTGDASIAGADGGSGWQVAGRHLAQRETGDRMIGGGACPKH